MFLLHYAHIAWIVVAVIWLISALNTKRARKREQTWSRAIQIVLVCCAYLLIFTTALGSSLLAQAIAPLNAGIAWIGFILTIAGISFALWARFLIGRNWSSDVTVKQGHQLIQAGPYRFVRHPIYAGFLVGLLGTAILTNELRAYLGLALAAAGWHLKAAVEEKLMSETFGQQYVQYKQRTKALIPFVL